MHGRARSQCCIRMCSLWEWPGILPLLGLLHRLSLQILHAEASQRKSTSCNWGMPVFSALLAQQFMIISYQDWATMHFRKISLSTIGLQYQLGHSCNTPCALQRPAHKEFTVIHNNRFHSIALYYCGCWPGYATHQQLIDNAWYPLTPLEPWTCATFSVLHQFHVLNLQVKTTSYDFYKVLFLLMDASGLSDILVGCPIVWESFLWIYSSFCQHRIIDKPSCTWFVNGATSRWRNDPDMVMTQVEFWRHLLVALLFSVAHVQNHQSTYC